VLDEIVDQPVDALRPGPAERLAAFAPRGQIPLLAQAADRMTAARAEATAAAPAERA